MKQIFPALLIATAILSGASADKPRVNRTSVTVAADRLDNKLATMLPDDPVSPIGLTQGAYIQGYGVIFMSTLNLAPMAGITPFHQTITKDEIARVHHKKVERLPKLRSLLQDMLVNMAASMDTVPPDEQIAIAVSLFNFSGEDTSGIPSQIVMHAPRKALLDGHANPSLLASAVRVDEF